MATPKTVEGIDLLVPSPWDRNTIADGVWLNSNSIDPIFKNDSALAYAIAKSSGSKIFREDEGAKSIKDLTFRKGTGRSYDAEFDDNETDSHMVIPTFNDSNHDDDQELWFGWNKDKGFDFYDAEHINSGCKNPDVSFGKTGSDCWIKDVERDGSETIMQWTSFDYNIGDGIHVDNGFLSVFADNTVSFDNDGKMHVNVPSAGKGLSTEDNIVNVNVGDGLSVDENNKLNVNVGDGLTIKDGKVITVDSEIFTKTIFETVDEMKAATYLKENDIVLTKRYYAYSNPDVFKDSVPGGCQYSIVTNASLNANDRNYGLNKDVIPLANGLYAKAILGAEAYPEQIGYIVSYSQANSMDLTPYIERLGQTGVTTVKLGKTAHINNWYDGDGVYRIRDKCNLTRSMKIQGIHDVVSGYATRIYFVPSANNTEKVMFDISARGVQIEDLIFVEATKQYSSSAPVWSDRQGTCIRLDRGTASLMTEIRRCAFQWFQYGIFTRDFTWHTTFAELQFASNYVNVHLGKLMYTTTFYNCLFNTPVYRNVEAISSPQTLEFNSCNFGMNKDNDTLFYVDRWYGEIVEVNERGGIFTFNNCNFEVEIKNGLYPNENPGVFLKNCDKSLSNFNYNNCVFIVTPLARAQRRNCRYFSVGPGGTIHFKNCSGPYEDVDIQDPANPTNNNFFLEKDFAKYFIDENRGCRKCIGGITVENCVGIDVTSLAKASYLSAIKTDSNIILTGNSTDITKYDAIPNGTIMLNLSNHKNASVIENKMFYINEIPGNFVKIGNDLYEYVEINGRGWINRNFYTRTLGRNDQYWNHMDWGLYYRNDEDQNIVPLLPAEWDFANSEAILELVGDGSASRAHELQAEGYQAFPNATNTTGFNMPPSYEWIRPYDASESNFTQGLFCGTAIDVDGTRTGCYVFKLNADSVSLETWDIATMNSKRLPYRFCTKTN